MRDALLSALLRKVSAGGAPEGLYDAVRHRREVVPGHDQTSTIASMVSWHESFHAFLNASTTYGVAMMLSGGLSRAGHPVLEKLVSRMIDHAIDVHETYATVASVCAVSRGPIDPSLLADYPAYQGYLERFLTLFDPSRPKLSAMVLTSGARAAMQTPIYDQLLALPCDRWSEIIIPAEHGPDHRFELIMTPECVERTIAAIDHAVVAQGCGLAPLALAGVDPAQEIACLLHATARDQELVNIAAFESFADCLAERGIARPAYDDQKRNLSLVLDKANGAGGSALGTAFQMPNEHEDAEALLHDFRNELLVYGAVPLRARSIDGRQAEIETAARLALRSDGVDYLQLVAMPSAKARSLYRGEDGGDPLLGWEGESVTFLRCGRRDEAGVRVDLLLLDGDRAIEIIDRYPAHLLVFTASLVSIRDPEWRAQWPEQEGEATKLLVMIDDDPFDLVTSVAARGTAVRFAGLTAGLRPGDDAQKIELLCLAADDEPALLYATPISQPYRNAIVDVALRTVSGACVDKSILTAWLPLLTKAVPHWVSEERTFGARFWH